MSYQVIARKWRPTTFQDLVGQDHITQTLLNALKADRLPHALLFSGTRGVGKTSSARLLAKALLCPNTQDANPCNNCEACAQATNGSHVDIIEIDGASNNGVESIRELRDTVGYMPASGRHKIYIIDEVHMLSTSAFNALLKTLEEPPSHVIFILATTEPQKIPVTILSRCQRFEFRRIPTRTIKEQLEKICTSENVEFEEDALWAIARLADGSMRDSLSLLDQIINFTGAQLTFEKVTDVLGLTDRTLLTHTLTSILNEDITALMQHIEQIFTAGYDPVNFMKDLLEQVRNLMMAKLSGDKNLGLLELADSEVENLKELGAHISAEDIHLLFDMALKGTQDVLRAENPRIALEMTLLRMAQAPRVVDLKVLLGQTSSNEAPVKKKTKIELPKPQAPFTQNKPAASAVSRLVQQPQKNTSAISESPTQSVPHVPGSQSLQAQPEAPAEKIQPIYDANKSPQQNWSLLSTALKQKNPLVSAQLEHISLIKLEAGVLYLGLHEKQKFLYEQVTSKTNIQRIEQTLKDYWGKAYKVQFELVNGEAPLSPHQAQKTKVEQRNKEIKNQVEAHPLIQKAHSIFKTEIQSIKEIK